MIERLLNALIPGDSGLTVDINVTVTVLVLNYLLSIADLVNYKSLSVKDQADFKLKVADLLEYVQKMGGGGA